MIEHLVFLLEEPSAADFLRGTQRHWLPHGVTSHFLVFEGKQDLEKQMVRRLRGWLRPNSRFLILRDQDSGDCVQIKRRLADLCSQAGRPEATVRIACRELEAFFVGDWQAVAEAFGKPALAAHDRKAKYRNPDGLGSPSRELSRAIPTYQKGDGARRISPLLEPQRNRSASFQALYRSLTTLAHS